MTHPILITSREILRNQKQVFQLIQSTGQPAIVSVQKQPQVAIISLEDFEQLKKLKEHKYMQSLLQLAEEAPHYNTGGPTDLSENLDQYAWGSIKKNKSIVKGKSARARKK